jgi:hypothetical protein
MKNKTPGISKQSVIAGYYPTLSLSGIQLYRQGSTNALGRNHLMGFWTDFSIGLN